MKSIIISVRPEYAQKILNGEKTLELRKSVPKDFVGWVYMYVTQAKPYLLSVKWTSHNMQTNEKKSGIGYQLFKDLDLKYQFLYPHMSILNGKVVARWWFDEYAYYNPLYFENTGIKQLDYLVLTDERIALCLDDVEINAYGNGKDLYAWHIKRLEIFDKPMELGEFLSREHLEYLYWLERTGMTNERKQEYVDMMEKTTLIKSPQSWQYVWVKDDNQ